MKRRAQVDSDCAGHHPEAGDVSYRLSLYYHLLVVGGFELTA
jgi:hypothetical protein